MRNKVVATLAAFASVLALATGVVATSPEATPSGTPELDAPPGDPSYECGDIPGYVDAVIAAWNEASPARESDEWDIVLKWDAGDIDYAGARPSEAAYLARFFDRLAGELEDIDPADVPRVAKEHLDAYIRLWSTYASGYNAVANGQVWAMMMYSEREEDIHADLDLAETTMDLACDGLWSKVWND